MSKTTSFAQIAPVKRCILAKMESNMELKILEAKALRGSLLFLKLKQNIVRVKSGIRQERAASLVFLIINNLGVQYSASGIRSCIQPYRSRFLYSACKTEWTNTRSGGIRFTESLSTDAILACSKIASWSNSGKRICFTVQVID
jgi:hypothetical protein